MQKLFKTRVFYNYMYRQLQRQANYHFHLSSFQHQSHLYAIEYNSISYVKDIYMQQNYLSITDVHGIVRSRNTTTSVSQHSVIKASKKGLDIHEYTWFLVTIYHILVTHTEITTVFQYRNKLHFNYFNYCCECQRQCYQRHRHKSKYTKWVSVF